MGETIECVRQYIAREVRLAADARLLVALSGGADSVCLLRIMLELGYTVEAAHCNFSLRGAESDGDEAFVRSLCVRLGVPLHVTRFDTRAVAAERHVSIEMAARDLRYAYFETLRTDRGLTDIAVAHHADDSVETFLLNLIRGTGLQGLRGIQPRVGHVVRPLLCLSRDDITAYLTAHGQDFVTDSTNLATDYTRNRIRLQLIPLMREINPSVTRTILQTARHLTDAATIYNRYMTDAARRVCHDDRIHIADLMSEPAPDALLYHLLSPLGFRSAQVADLMRALPGQPGRVFRSPEWMAVKDRDDIVLTPIAPTAEPELTFETCDVGPDFTVPRDPAVACIDADLLRQPLRVRTVAPGDWFIPLGMSGRKLLSDFMTDRKLTVTQKAAQRVVCSGEDIVWVVGMRIDHRYRVTRDTRRVVFIRQA